MRDLREVRLEVPSVERLERRPDALVERDPRREREPVPQLVAMYPWPKRYRPTSFGTSATIR
jgi:hypothetical protein